MRPHEARNRDELIAAMAGAEVEGPEASFLFFWGHTPKTAGAVDKSCLSNWFPAPFELEGLSYATTEHYMMAEKARVFGDQEMSAEIIACPTPGDAKRCGRRVSGFDDAVWKIHRFEIVVRGNVEKFRQNDGLRDFLLATGDAVLVEASPRDRIWGIGLGQSNPKAQDPSTWRGLNLLGFALMEARQRLRAHG